MSLLPCVAYLRLQRWWWHYWSNVPPSRPDLQGGCGQVQEDRRTDTLYVVSVYALTTVNITL